MARPVFTATGGCSPFWRLRSVWVVRRGIDEGSGRHWGRPIRRTGRFLRTHLRNIGNIYSDNDKGTYCHSGNITERIPRKRAVFQPRESRFWRNRLSYNMIGQTTDIVSTLGPLAGWAKISEQIHAPTELHRRGEPGE